MSDLVRYKRSAEIIPTPRGATATYAPPALTPATIRGASKRDVLDELARRKKAGTIATTGQLRLLTQGRHAGTYILPVEIQAPPARPRWRKPVKIAAWIAAPTATIAGLGWWAAATLGGLPLAVLLGAILVWFVWLVRRSMGGGSSSSNGRGGVSVTTTTTVNFH